MSTDIRDNLKSVIHDKDYIQAAVAKRANITAVKLSQILNKERVLETDEMFRLCEAIGMTPTELREYNSHFSEEKGA